MEHVIGHFLAHYSSETVVRSERTLLFIYLFIYLFVLVFKATSVWAAAAPSPLLSIWSGMGTGQKAYLSCNDVAGNCHHQFQQESY
jgi:hypothetical protein